VLNVLKSESLILQDPPGALGASQASNVIALHFTKGYDKLWSRVRWATFQRLLLP